MPSSTPLRPMGLTLEADPLRVRAMFAGHVIADSNDVLIVRREGREPMRFFPREDVETGYLGKSGTSVTDLDLGPGSCFTWVMEGEIIENAVCAFDEPPEGLEALSGRLCLSERYFEIYELTPADLDAAPRASQAHGSVA